MFVLIVLCLGSFTAAAHAAHADPAKVDSLILASTDTTLEWETRRDLAKQAMKHDRSGRAMHALARLKLEKATTYSRQQARSLLKRAREREPENADYVATFAELLWRTGPRSASFKKAREAIALDPKNVRAHYWAGRYVVWSWEMTFFTRDQEGDETRVARDGDVTTGRTFAQRGYADMEVDVGIDYLSRALWLDAHHWPSRVYLGLAYYMARMPDALIALFEEDLERHPDRTDAYFFAGLGHQAKGDPEAAYRAYVDGLARLPDRERRFMQSVFLMLDKKAWKKGEPPPDEAAIQKFWFGRDPLYLSAINERMLEQCRRVAYANLRFGDPINGYAGWETDRGQAYIRYGDPLARQMTPADIDLGLTRTFAEEAELRRQGKVGPTGMIFDFQPRKDTWTYEGFEVSFLNTNSWDSWRFGRSKLGGRTLNFNELVKAIPDYYRYPYQYSVPYQIAQFRRDEEKTSVEVYYALPGDQVAHEEVGPGVRAVDVVQAMFLFDAAWDTLRKEVGRVRRMPWIQYVSTKRGYLLASEQLALAPGDYHLAGEAEDQANKKVGTFRDRLRVRRFSRDSLEISSLLMARRIVERDEWPMERARFMVLPNPLRECSRNGSAWFYFEVYNLSRDTFGATHYRIGYQTQVIPETRGEGEAQPQWTTAVSYTYRGVRDWEPRYLRVDMADTSPGLRAFRVVIEDSLAGTAAESTTRFRVRW